MFTAWHDEPGRLSPSDIVKLDAVPDNDRRAVSVWAQAGALAEGALEMREWHRATPAA